MANLSRSIRIVLLFLPFTLAASVCTRGGAALRAMEKVTSNPSFGHPYDTLTLRSKFVEQQFEMNVMVPPHSENERLAVVYFADSDLLFDLLPSLARNLVVSGVPPVILVGIGYPGNLVDSNWGQLRVRDLLDMSDEELQELASTRPEIQTILESLPGAGHGAAHFLEFIRQELIPLIEEEYRADPKDRVFFGVSGGSLFGQYVLAHKPDTFTKYIIASGYSPRSIESVRDHARAVGRIDAKLFFAVGLDEPLQLLPNGKQRNPELVSRFYKFAAMLESEHIPGLDYSFLMVEDGVHSATTWVPAFEYGMRAVFLGVGCKPSLGLDSHCSVSTNGKR